MNFSIQPYLENELIKLIPLQPSDFERIYKVASAPAVWANHPNKNRFEREVFANFFKGAIESGGGFIVIEKKNERVIGCTRFYGYNENEASILIGYTFYAVDCWGKGYNHSVKTIMLDYIFQFVNKVIFHIGAENFRSQSAILKLGAIKTAELTVAYYGEPDRKNFEYQIKKQDWQTRNLS